MRRKWLTKLHLIHPRFTFDMPTDLVTSALVGQEEGILALSRGTCRICTHIMSSSSLPKHNCITGDWD